MKPNADQVEPKSTKKDWAWDVPDILALYLGAAVVVFSAMSFDLWRSQNSPNSEQTLFFGVSWLFLSLRHFVWAFFLYFSFRCRGLLAFIIFGIGCGQFLDSIPLLFRTRTLSPYQWGNIGPIAMGLVFLLGCYGLWRLLLAWKKRAKWTWHLGGLFLIGLCPLAFWADLNFLQGQYPYLHTHLVSYGLIAGTAGIALLIRPFMPRWPALVFAITATLALAFILSFTRYVPQFDDSEIDTKLMIYQDLRTTQRLIEYLPFELQAEAEDELSSIDAGAAKALLGDLEARRRMAMAFPNRIKNAIVISIDALRNDHCSFEGYARPTTPFLDELTKSSTVFSHSYSGSPSSYFSIPTLLSGVYPPTVVARKGARPQTLADHFRAAGFSTFGIYDRAMIHAMRDHSWPKQPQELGFENHLRVNSCDQSVAAILAHTQGLQGKPFFVYSHFMEPHAPYDTHLGFEFGTKAIDRYDSEIAFCDAQLKRLVQGLEKQGLLESTVLVITGDHGEEFGEHGHTHHGSNIFEPMTRVPLIFKIPGLKGQRVDTPVSNLALAPTLTGILKQGALRDVEVADLIPQLLGREDENRTPAFVFRPALSQLPSWHTLVATIDGPFKLIENLHLGLYQLYHLGDDPAERRNLASARPEIVRSIQAKRRQWNHQRRSLIETRRQQALGAKKDAQQSAASLNRSPESQALASAKSALNEGDLSQLETILDSLDLPEPGLALDAARTLLQLEFPRAARDSLIAKNPKWIAARSRPDIAIYHQLLNHARKESDSSETAIKLITANDGAADLAAQSLAIGGVKPALRTALNAELEQQTDWSKTLQWDVAIALAAPDTVELFPSLAAAIQAEPGLRSKLAAQALMHLPDETIWPLLRELSQSNTSLHTMPFIHGIHHNPTNKRRTWLKQLLSHVDVSIRIAALEAAIGIADEALLEEMAYGALLHDNSPIIRKLALKIATRIPNSGSRQILGLAFRAHGELATPLVDAIDANRPGGNLSVKGFVHRTLNQTLTTNTPKPVAEYVLKSRLPDPLYRALLRFDLSGAQAQKISIIGQSGRTMAELSSEMLKNASNLSTVDLTWEAKQSVIAVERPLSLLIESKTPSTIKLVSASLGIAVHHEALMSLEFRRNDRPYLKKLLSRDWQREEDPQDGFLLQQTQGSFGFHEPNEIFAGLRLGLRNHHQNALMVEFRLGPKVLGSHRLIPGYTEVDLEFGKPDIDPKKRNTLVLVLKWPPGTKARRDELRSQLSLHSVQWLPKPGKYAPKGRFGLAAMKDPKAAIRSLEPLRFSVAGHVYGRHGNKTPGLFPPFKSAFRRHQAVQASQFLALTGDFLVTPSPRFMQGMDADLSELRMPTLMAPGNHENVAGNLRHPLRAHYGQTYGAFMLGRDAFILADSHSGEGNIEGPDLQNLLSMVGKKPRSIFIFVHHLVWIDQQSTKMRKWSRKATNSINAGYAHRGEFWDRILPILKASGASVFVIAGDLGANSEGIEHYFKAADQVHLLATGMGENKDVGCYLDVEVNQQGVQFKTHYLGPNPKSPQGSDSRIQRIPQTLIPFGP